MTNFKYGETREDGFVYWGKQMRNGKWSYRWLSPEAFQRQVDYKAILYQRKKAEKQVLPIVDTVVSTIGESEVASQNEFSTIIMRHMQNLDTCILYAVRFGFKIANSNEDWRNFRLEDRTACNSSIAGVHKIIGKVFTNQFLPNLKALMATSEIVKYHYLMLIDDACSTNPDDDPVYGPHIHMYISIPKMARIQNGNNGIRDALINSFESLDIDTFHSHLIVEFAELPAKIEKETRYISSHNYNPTLFLNSEIIS